MSFDSVDENAAFVKKFDFPYSLLCDTDRSLGVAYGACDSPSDQHARRVSYIIGADGSITHAFEKVDASTHPTEVLGLI